jgi:hypothetical protein
MSTDKPQYNQHTLGKGLSDAQLLSIISTLSVIFVGF